MSSENPPYLSYVRSIVISKTEHCIGQSSAFVTLFLSCIVSVTFCDKTSRLSHNFRETILDKDSLSKNEADSDPEVKRITIQLNNRLIEKGLHRTNWDTKTVLSKDERSNFVENILAI